MNPRLLLPTLGLLVFLASCDQPNPEVRQIIVLDIDTLRASHLGCYGYHRDTSPRIDALARESHLFEWAFSQAPNTPPSQASILTGLYPSTHGMIGDEDRLHEDVTSLADALLARGFKTAAFVDGGYMSARFGMDQGFELYDDSEKRGLAVIGPKVFDWVSRHRDDPFLLLVHTYDVHTPYDPAPPYRSMFLDGLAPPTPGFEPSSEQMEAVRTSAWTEGAPRKLPENDLEYAKALYDAGIRQLDDWVGRFLDELRRLGLYERAVIVLLSDHGEEFQEHGSVLHDKLYATVTHVPLIVRLPGQRRGRIVSQTVENVDLMPSLLELAGAPIPSETQGRSFVPLLGGRKDPPYVAFGESPYFGERRSVALDNYRLLYTRHSGAVELYDFVADPNEQVDLATERPELATQLRETILRWQTMVEQSESFRAKGGPLSPEVLDQLRALGYVK